MINLDYDPRNIRMRHLEGCLAIDTNDCIEWPYSLAGRGYGVVLYGGRQTYAHRVACEATNGAPPTSKHHAAHSCGNRLCVNKKHISWATAKENAADKKVHGTNNDGEAHGMAALTNEQAAEIRGLAKKGIRQAALARKFGVTPMTVSRIVRNLSYKCGETA